MKHTGVRQKPTGRWEAHLKYKGKQIHLGSFRTQGEAIKARKLSKLRYTYKPHKHIDIAGLELNAEIIRELLDYNPETGRLFWKERDKKWFKTTQSANSWNTEFAGTEAFTAKRTEGRMHGRIFEKNYAKHRICWLHYHGAWPENVIDHIDGDPTNNRISNLRDVAQQENALNQKLRNTNKSGQMGVCEANSGSRWRAYITVDGKQVNLGQFENKDDAIAARKAAEVKYGFHPNHGRKVEGRNRP